MTARWWKARQRTCGSHFEVSRRRKVRLRQASSALCAGSRSSPTHSVMSHHVSGRPCLHRQGSQARACHHSNSLTLHVLPKPEHATC